MLEKSMIEKLMKAGVSADVILGLIMYEEKQPEPEKKPEPEKTPEPEKKPEQPAPAAVPQGDAILAAIEKLTGAVQAANLQRGSFKSEQPETVDSILASVIAPTKK